MSRSGRLIKGDWDGGKPRQAKPPLPLHYRINPLEQKLDELDNLERELDRAFEAGQVETEHYYHQRDVIEGRRDALAARTSKLAGVAVAKPPKDTPVVVKAVKTHHRAPQRASPLSRHWFFICVICITYFILKGY